MPEASSRFVSFQWWCYPRGAGKQASLGAHAKGRICQLEDINGNGHSTPAAANLPNPFAIGHGRSKTDGPAASAKSIRHIFINQRLSSCYSLAYMQTNSMVFAQNTARNSTQAVEVSCNSLSMNQLRAAGPK